MIKHIAPISALILGSAFLMFAGGVHGLILPLRGSIEGFAPFSLGLLGTGWAAGYIAGCIFVPRLVQRVGHIRTLGVTAALAGISVLLSLMIIHSTAWIPLRALAGFCFAGAAMIVESWLNEQTEAQYRGRVFGIYSMVSLGMTTVGQMSITLGDITGYAFFVLAAIFYSLALIPTALSTARAPTPLTQANLDLKALWKNSPIAVAGVFLVGVSNSAFGTLGAVYGEKLDFDVSTIALFMSLSLLMGALFQLPVGVLSDRIDRRLVLISLTFLAALVDLFFIFLEPHDPLLVLIAAGLFGGSIYAMYPVIVAHANDHAEGGAFLKVSGGLLLIFGSGSILGPLVAGSVMGLSGASGLFYTTFGAHGLLALYTIYRMSRRAAVKSEDKENFVTIPTTRLMTPETAVLDPRAEETVQEDEADHDPKGVFPH